MMNPEKITNRIKLFGMQNLMLESDLDELEKRGIDLGRLSKTFNDDIVDPEFFENDIMFQAKKMADFYVLYYAFENTLRRLISQRMEENYGVNWWEDKVPGSIKEKVKQLKDKEKDTVMSIRSDDPLYYTSFGELIGIFDKNWTDFADTIRSQRAMRQVLTQFNLLRNLIAHSCELPDNEIIRLKLLLNDWFGLQI